MHKQLDKKYPTVATISIVLLITIVFTAFSQSRFNPLPQIIASTVHTQNLVTFPEINTLSLSAEQQALITVLEQEYAAQPKGEKYSEGITEPWCANFVSWVFKESGLPLSNPNNGYWRIPGTYTLRDYYESKDLFMAAGSDYSPKAGDIMLYDNPSPFGQHTNIVIENNKGIVTTIGGNEPGGIRIFKHITPDDAGFIGYGILQTQ